MAIKNKRVKTFSPYKYNIQYTKPGQGINQQPKQHIKTAIIPEQELVISKAEPKYFTFLDNIFYYNIHDDYSIKFNKLISTFSIVKQKNFKEYSNILINSNKKLNPLTFTISNNNLNTNTSCYWKTNNIIRITHMLNSKVDCFVLLNDYEYLNVQKHIISNNILEIIFNRNFNNSDKISIIIFQLESNFSIIDNAVILKSYLNNEIIYDDLKEMICLDNKFGKSSLFSIVYNLNDVSYILDGYDSSPSYIAFNKNNFISINSLKDENLLLDSNIKNIKNKNKNLSDDYLYLNNFQYKLYVDKIEENNKKINELNELNYTYDISRIELYYLNTKCYKYKIFQNLNNNNIKWNNNIVNVFHNMNSNVIINIDSDKIYKYVLYKDDLNNISIKFLNEIPSHFSISIYKVN